MNEIDIRMASSFSRAVTRRTFIRRMMQGAFVAGVTLSGILKFPRAAQAVGCSPGGIVGYGSGGCYCANTMSCSGSKCGYGSGTCQGGATPRCNHWKTWGPGYCWCSNNCCINGWRGYYSCCDCWEFGGACASGNTSCICKQRVVTVPC